jgi:hypothetical protein
MLDTQSRIEEERSRNLDLLNDPDNFRQPLASFKLVVNKQKQEWVIAFLRNITDIVS